MTAEQTTIHALQRHIEDILGEMRTRKLTDEHMIEYCKQVVDIKKTLDKRLKTAIL